MNRTVVWICAVILTLGLSAWQRRSGPTYPLSGHLTLKGREVRYRLERSHAGPGGATVSIAVPEAAGTLHYRLSASGDPWTTVEMPRDGETIAATIPHQPIAGKVDYFVELRGATQSARLGPVTIRFRGDVPAAILIPHILSMFLGFLFAARAGLAAARGEESGRFVLATLVLIGIGGLILGPIVQKIGLGAYWTGWPLGPDLTDNKTLVAWLFWLPAWRTRRRGWIAAAAAVTFVVFAIPHSLLSGNVVQ
jgi:hypothetical protein